jgi:hypothetical protein
MVKYKKPGKGDYETALEELNIGHDMKRLSTLYTEREIDKYREKQNRRICGGSILFFLTHGRRMNIKEYLECEKAIIGANKSFMSMIFPEIFDKLNNRFEKMEKLKKLDTLIEYLENDGITVLKGAKNEG